ncbi:MAG: hypothetical protein MUO67_25380 [Anaerolineales bacterium]|nr:hypothetical protein [Anaerolineales bacterium]
MVRSQSLGVALLASSTLLLESALLRFLAVSQYYHFAFLVISLALLGFGASGSFLVLTKRLRINTTLDRGPDLLIVSGILFAASIVTAYGTVNFLPFDSYSIAWERRQFFFFIIYYLVLALPFFFSGLCIGGSLSIYKERSNIIYAANLLGSGIGVLLAPIAMWLAGVPGALIGCAAIGVFTAFLGVRIKNAQKRGFRNERKYDWRILTLGGVFLFLILIAGVLSVLNLTDSSILGIMISPYKGLPQAKLYPGSEVIIGRWNEISRIDVLSGAGTRQLPGLSYKYSGSLPIQHGISVDADSIQPITLIGPEDFAASLYMPESLAFQLRPEASVLIIEPSGGLGVLQALSGKAKSVDVIISNPLLVESVKKAAPEFHLYDRSDVNTILESPRVYIKQTKDNYDIIFIPLTDSYKPVTSGAYSLSETYNLTVEAFEDYLDKLMPGGMIVISRWLQTPPSESLKILTTIIDSLQKDGISNPNDSLIAYRGIQTITVLVKPDGWRDDELNSLREFLDSRRFDLVFAPDMKLEEANQYNKLPTPVYYEYFSILVSTDDIGEFISEYPYAIDPPTDNRPFFYHFFTWEQTPEVLARVGRTWQPFGGSGYFVLLALLLLVVFFSVALILVPVLTTPGKSKFGRPFWRILVYFSLLGIAFLFIEIPLIQQSILILGHPTYAFTLVVFAMLAFSSIGSYFTRSRWLPKRSAMLILIILSILSPWVITQIASLILGWPFIVRAIVIGMCIAPLAILMGIPFPYGLVWLEHRWGRYIPWAWAVNGCASVIAAVLAAILTLSYGYQIVLLLGATAYAFAFLVFPRKWNKANRT